MINPTTGSVEPIQSFPEAKNTNPQWSPDGKSLYFLGDPEGITNAYRLDLTDGRIYQVTNLFTGISGITSLSPALSVAKDVDKMAFSVYEDGDYNVYVADSPEVLRGTLVSVRSGQ
jgi:Tol biopolymer transport system component